MAMKLNQLHRRDDRHMENAKDQIARAIERENCFKAEERSERARKLRLPLKGVKYRTPERAS